VRPWLAFAALFVLVVVALFGRGASVPVAPPPPARERPRAPARTADRPLDPPSRNVFEYAAPKPVERPSPAYVPPPPTPALESAPPPEPPVRLVGLVRRAGALRAALSVHGETVVVGVGDAAGDYRVIAVDEDGVRLRAPDGSTLTLVTSGP
jgi:hypothetical protein